jgi:hypothetical protein
LLDKSVTNGAVGDYSTNPITIVTKSGSSVTFEVQQSFVKRDLGWLAVHFVPVDGKAPDVCYTTEALSNSTSTPKYSAKCYNGYALVDLFAYDCTFKNMSDVVIPSSCDAWNDGSMTAAFHFSIPCDPDPVGDICEDSICIPESRLVKKSVPSGAYGDVLSNPVNIVHYGVDVVKFRIEQNWKDGDLSFLSVQYKPNTTATATTTVCMSTEGVSDVSSTPEYTAKCVNGYAVIDIFAYDCTFTGVPGTVVVPPTCKAWKGDGKTSHFQYTIPCDKDDASFCLDEPLCIPEATVISKSVTSGSVGDFKAMPITILRQGGSTVEFQVEQTWKDGEIGYIAVDYNPADQLKNATCVATEAIGKGYSTPTLMAACVNGVAEIDVYGYDCTFTGVPNIDQAVPGSCQPFIDIGKKVHFKFAVPCLCAATPSTPTVAAASRSTSTNVLQCTKDLVEDYETFGQSTTWSYGTEYADAATYTTFLGRLGMNHPEVSKTFTIPSTANTVDLSFNVYDLTGDPTGTDKFMVGVQGSYLDMNLFQANGVKKFYNDIAVTATSMGGYKYNVMMTIPKSWYASSGNKLPITFKFVTSQLIYGIDNVRLHANCARRQLEGGHGDVVADTNESTMNVIDTEPVASYYCSSDDFPCGEDETMVHVCHYSSRTGYETHCIPEPDSEILRFYSQDYCGPCVGTSLS